MKTIYVVIGPTASGKSDRAVELALEISGEVINADSRQVYIGLDVGTAKITAEEMKGVRHHLLSYVPPQSLVVPPVRGELISPLTPSGALDSTPSAFGSSPRGALNTANSNSNAPLGELPAGLRGSYSVSRYITDARVAIDDIISRGKVPIICGGTGMYIYSLIYGLDHDVVPDFKLRQDLNKIETKELFNKYKEINGEPADNSISNNRPRLIRALEVGKIKNNENRPPLYNVKYIKMERSKEELRERITRRAEQRLDAMIAETESLLDANIDREWLSRVGIEYREILKYLNKEIDIAQLRDNIILRSLQYAKRQNTWNKKYCA